MASRRIIVGSMLVAVATSSGRARAAAFQISGQNASGLGNAYAGQAAAAEDASTLFANPAGLTLVPGLQLVAAVELLAPSNEFTDAGSTAARLQPLGRKSGNSGGLAPIPNGYLSVEALPGVLWAGLGVSVPFGLDTEWERDWVGRFHAVTSNVRTLNINPAAAWRVHPWISIGAGLNLEWMSAELTNAVNYSDLVAGTAGPAALPALAACPGASVGGTGCEGQLKVTGSGWSWGWNAGALIEFPTRTRLGIAYRSAIQHTLDGTATYSNAPSIVAPGLPQGDVRAVLKLPDSAWVAVAQQLGPVQLLGEYRWTGWSSLRDIAVVQKSTGAPFPSTPLRLEDTWRVALGANLQLHPMWKLRAGVAYDRSAVRDLQTARLPDEDRTWLAAGVQWTFSTRGAIDVGLARLFVKDAASNVPDVEPGARLPSTGGVVGKYTGGTWVAGVQGRYSFPGSPP